ncbi:hypothetical protein [Duncaniella dubosii]|jgi:uncharacterized membrane protein|uniref:hypothetical protein n=1 Tax=Duncaniella dubosii TaxID=2518971 RepID=UPI0023F2EB54|nr:hypothetical protein [Duncaniella dubosii]MCX4285454.1 hypothetical protein [Duncaniella dubosii]
MKKLKNIVTSILKLFAVLLPGIFTGVALWRIHGALVTILASLGVEFIWAAFLTFAITVAGQIKAQIELRKEKADTTE